MEKRKNTRFDVSQEMKGKLLNVVSFVANNISVDGINLVSNFQPVIGSTYKIYLMHNRDNIQQDFEIEINRAEVAVFDSKKYAALPPGLLFLHRRQVQEHERKTEGDPGFFHQEESAGSRRRIHQQGQDQARFLRLRRGPMNARSAGGDHPGRGPQPAHAPGKVPAAGRRPPADRDDRRPDPPLFRAHI